MTKDYYDILGVSRTATDAEIRRAFRRKARELHPDVNPGPDAKERFQELNAAYEVLGDPVRRSVYDRMPLQGSPQAGQAPSPYTRRDAPMHRDWPPFARTNAPPRREPPPRQPPYARTDAPPRREPPPAPVRPAPAARRAGRQTTFTVVGASVFALISGIVVTLALGFYPLTFAIVGLAALAGLNFLRVLSRRSIQILLVIGAIVVGMFALIVLDDVTRTALGSPGYVEPLLLVGGTLFVSMVMAFAAYAIHLSETLRLGTPREKYMPRLWLLASAGALFAMLLLAASTTSGDRAVLVAGLALVVLEVGLLIYTRFILRRNASRVNRR